MGVLLPVPDLSAAVLLLLKVEELLLERLVLLRFSFLRLGLTLAVIHNKICRWAINLLSSLLGSLEFCDLELLRQVLLQVLFVLLEICVVLFD